MRQTKDSVSMWAHSSKPKQGGMERLGMRRDRARRGAEAEFKCTWLRESMVGAFHSLTIFSCANLSATKQSIAVCIDCSNPVLICTVAMTQLHFANGRHTHMGEVLGRRSFSSFSTTRRHSRWLSKARSRMAPNS